MMPSPHGSTKRTPQLSGAVDLSVRLGSLELKNPVMTASGTFGSGKEYADFIDLESLGAVVTKGVGLDAWEGNPGIRVFETPSGMLNSIGLQNPGVEAFCATDLAWLANNAPHATIIVNVVGHAIDEYARVIERLEREAHVAAYEVNISCPNVDRGGLAFGVDAEVAAEVTRSCRAATKRPLIMKLSPNVTDITEIACACEMEGADALSLINTVLGTAIDVEKRRFRFERQVAGLSGPAIKPIALRMVHATAQATAIPVIGMGGIRNATDAIEFLLAGASVVAVGTGNFVDPCTTIDCIEGIDAYCQNHGFSVARDLVGAVNRKNDHA